jgi:hypothetical protein
LSTLDIPYCPDKHNERLIELKEQLVEEVIILAYDILTIKQLNIFVLWITGATQVEIAIKLGISKTSNSSIYKSLYGNADFKLSRSSKKKYGGTFPKLKYAAKNNIEIQKILQLIEEEL